MSSKSVVSEITNSQNGFFGGRAEGQITGVKILTVVDLEKMWVCAGTTADYAVYLPKPSECAGKIVGFRMDPGLTKLVTLDAGQTDNVKTGTVQVRTGTGVNILPTIYFMVFPSGSYTGTSWKPSNNSYYAAGVIHIGDRINWDNQQGGNAATKTFSRYIATLVTDNSSYSTMTASFVWDISFTYTSGPVTVDYTGILGTNTTFLTDLTVGGLMWVGGESRTVVAIIDDTHCGVDTPFTTAGSGLTYSASGTPYSIDDQQTRIMWANEVAILYSDGYKWTKIAGKSIPMSVTLKMTADAAFAVSTQTTVPLDTVMSQNCPNAMIDLTNKRVNLLRRGMWQFDATIQFNYDNATATNALLALIITSITGWTTSDVAKNAASSYATRQISTKQKVTSDSAYSYIVARYDSGSSALTLKGYTTTTDARQNFRRHRNSYLVEEKSWKCKRLSGLITVTGGVHSAILN